MGTVATTTVQERITTAISTTLAAAGWQEMTSPFGGGDGEGRLHMSYFVDVPGNDALKDRQRISQGCYSQTDVAVMWAWNLAALDQNVSYKAALTGEAAILAAVMTKQRSTDMALIYVSLRHPVDADGWVNGVLRFRAIHNLPLS